MISSVVALFVGRSAAKATVEAARIAADAERAKAADEDKRQARAALMRALEGWDIAILDDADWRVRQENAGRARRGLIELVAIFGVRVKTPDFDELLERLSARDESDLQRARELWPTVQQAILRVLEP